MKKIILCGYMGSGKTTTARLLSNAAEIPYMDLDEIIEKETGKTVEEIFATDGEIKFRKLEHNILKGLLDVNEDFILGLGGGTPCYANNHLLLQRNDVVSVYLKTGIKEVVKRVQGQGRTRPLLANLEGAALEEFIGQHLFERSYFYHHAKHVVLTDGKSPAQVADEIMSLL
ncbi:shikimate kinase [Flavobacterium psychrotrophum]|uniref:shikimate kinase n=1 Tax=Flavobacterium psychrotrophum TaxID=2294119 RepID=UPI000E312B99|nr:shikimate kinase [Flavobacterium psychrotrophum]